MSFSERLYRHEDELPILWLKLAEYEKDGTTYETSASKA